MWPCIKLKHLQERLDSVAPFKKPNILLEQYVTPSELSSHILYTIQLQHGDISGKIVGDLGCGTGVLSIGAGVLGAGLVIGFEIDQEALGTFQENVEDQDLNNIECIQCDLIEYLPEKYIFFFTIMIYTDLIFVLRFNKKFDTIIMNPPFGTKHNAGIDMKFLKTALSLSDKVYSLHKSTTR